MMQSSRIFFTKFKYFYLNFLCPKSSIGFFLGIFGILGIYIFGLKDFSRFILNLEIYSEQ